MKRIFSKKSGFTLVEIVVAFAIFAIMSAMILSMVRLTVQKQNSNNEFADGIEEQTGYLAYHYINDADKYVSEDDKFNLKFYKDDGTVACNVNMQYDTRTSVLYVEDENGNLVANTNMAEGINYFVGNVDYANVSNPPEGQPGGDNIFPGLGNSQVARYDTRISGSKGISEILIKSVEKKTTPEDAAAGRSRYVITCSAEGKTPSVASENAPYLQYRLRFCNSTAKDKDITGADGKTFTYKLYEDAKMVDCGYYNNGNYYTHSSHSPDKNNMLGTLYTVTPTSDSIVRIGIPYSKKDTDTYKNGMDSLNNVTFYVVFDGDPNLTLDSFGQNGGTGTIRRFTAFPKYNDKDEVLPGQFNLNIYGAFLYQKTEKK